MTLNPILKVLSVMRSHKVRFLLIGGQACVLYGGSEFSRDTDLAILAEQENINRLHNALSELMAEQIAVPALSLEYLNKGHAVHFRCRHPDTAGMRVDIMATIRNAAPFETLWNRRSTIELENGTAIEVISLPDLIAIKKTQRDKDWQHIRRLVEAQYEEKNSNPASGEPMFWLCEARTVELIREIAAAYPLAVQEASTKRPLLRLLPCCSDDELRSALVEEENREKEADRAYWRPLIKELEALRHSQRSYK